MKYLRFSFSVFLACTFFCVSPAYSDSEVSSDDLVLDTYEMMSSEDEDLYYLVQYYCSCRIDTVNGRPVFGGPLFTSSTDKSGISCQFGGKNGYVQCYRGI